MVLMDPESSLLLSIPPLTLLTDPRRLSELEAAREFFRFTADDADALPFRLLLMQKCIIWITYLDTKCLDSSHIERGAVASTKLGNLEMAPPR